MKLEATKPSIKNQGEWRRLVYTLRFYEEKFSDETKRIDKVMLGQVESWRIEKQFGWYEFWEQFPKIPKWESEGMKTKVKNNMQPLKKINDDKEIEQQQSKVWDPRKLQAEIMEQQQRDKISGQRKH